MADDAILRARELAQERLVQIAKRLEPIDADEDRMAKPQQLVADHRQRDAALGAIEGRAPVVDPS
ncbi:MAG: hypothetical protein M5U28_48145 [Sandaracinaceae bacterium]|nr:hypothetical protein [Sandaracinaceae bacterium]